MEKITLFIQAVATVAIVATFIVYWRQLVAMRGQLSAMQHSSRSQSLLTLIDLLQRPATIEARGILFGLEGKDSTGWTREERLAAERAISAYDIAGILIRDGAVPDGKRVLTDNWGYSIRKCHQIASPYIAETRKTRGNKYWDDFEWLANQIPNDTQRVVPGDGPRAARSARA
ncbi:MAG: DUF4760 domain-containing protein [Pyrinomonadaceae bacterium]